jgi:hypothetical protein
MEPTFSTLRLRVKRVEAGSRPKTPDRIGSAAGRHRRDGPNV